MKKHYRHLFKPLPVENTEPNAADIPVSSYSTGEHRGGDVYVLDEKTVFAIQVAQETGRPLLLQGPAGSGKSSLAPFVAKTLDCRFYSFTVTARSQARDLMWSFDALGRLNDANVAGADDEAKERVKDINNYISARELWWTLNRNTAGKPDNDPATLDPANPDEPLTFTNNEDVVLLIDEIDKADPDVPNNLLEVLGSSRFTVAETDTKIGPAENQFPLIMITTNNERELPAAFLRRCIVLHLDHKEADELVTIATQHFGEDTEGLYLPVATALVELRGSAIKAKIREPSTAEYLDAVRACREMKIGPNSTGKKAELWNYLLEVGLSKTAP